MQKLWLFIICCLISAQIMAYSENRCDYPECRPPFCVPPLYTSWCSSPKNVYVRGSVGLAAMPKFAFKFYDPSNPDPVNQITTSHDAAGADLAVGYRFHDLRFELAASYLYNQFKDNYNPSGNTSVPFYSGYVDGPMGMFNAYFDYNNPTPIFPYIGAGIGILQRHYQWRMTNNDPANDYRLTTNHLAGQGILGLGYRVNACLSFLADYRYIMTPNYSEKITNNAANKAQISFNNTLRYTNNVFSLGAIWEF